MSSTGRLLPEPARADVHILTVQEGGRALTDSQGSLTSLGKLAMGVVCAALLLTALDQTAVVTALTYMSQDLNVPITEPNRLAWIVSGYLLGYVIAMPLMGRVADVFGRWRVFALCVTLFLFGSLVSAISSPLGSPISPDTTSLGGFLLAPIYTSVQWLMGLLARLNVDTTSPGLDVLIGGRFLQAVGGGALVPLAMAMVSDLFGSSRRGLALGLVGAVTEAGGVLGPLWGAWLTTHFGWQAIFSVNIPVAAAVLAAGFFCIPRRRGAREPIDVGGALLFGASLTCLTLGLGQQTGAEGTFSLSSHISTNPKLLLAALAFFGVFLLLELRLRWPMIELHMFSRTSFSAAALLSFFTGAALITALVEIPLYLDSLRGYSAIEAGLALLRLTVLIPVGAIAGGWLSSRVNAPLAATCGCLLTALGLWQMHLWPLSVTEGTITLSTAVAGMGFGLVIAPISSSALNASEPSQAGSASAIVTALRMTGMILGLAGLVAWGLSRFQILMAEVKIGGTPTSSAYAIAYARALDGALHEVYTDIFAVAAIIMLLGVVPALLLWRRNPHEAHSDTHFESFVAPLG
ncbi:MAG: MFS transporter [Ktedonobacterales bacterium]